MSPLLPKKTATHNGNPWAKIGSWKGLLGGILMGIMIGTAVSMLLFPSAMPPTNDKREPRDSEILPTLVVDKQEASRGTDEHEVKTEKKEISEEDKIVEDFVNQQLAPARKAPSLKLGEGHRVLSEFERKGGWRFTPDVLKVAEKHPKAKIISETQPLLIQFTGFLASEEISHMLEVASSHMSRSKVVTGKDGAERDARTSYGAWLNGQYRDQVVENVEKRIHDTIGLPLSFGEGIYVLRYEKEQKYDPHTDNCARKGEEPRDACLRFLKRAGGPECGEDHGGASCGDRIATFIMYLKAPTKGGETVFPQAKLSKDRVRKAGRSERASGFQEYCTNPAYLKLLPAVGDAVLFWDYIPRPDVPNHETFSRSGSFEWKNQTTEATNDNSSLHGGCPVLEGEKWIATRWIRSSYFH